MTSFSRDEISGIGDGGDIAHYFANNRGCVVRKYGNRLTFEAFYNKSGAYKYAYLVVGIIDSYPVETPTIDK